MQRFIGYFLSEKDKPPDMKLPGLAPFLPAFIIMVVISCGKGMGSEYNNVAGDSAALSGKWQILLDTQYVGAGAGNHLSVYHGKAGDYFDFGSGGKLAVSEAGVQNTLTYAVYPNSKIIISSFGITLNGIPDTSTISELTPHTISIGSHFFPTPGGTFGRKVMLTR